MVRFQADTVAAPMHMTSEIYIISHFVALGSVLSLPPFFFPILNLKRLKALLISRCKSSLWKKNWIIFNFVDFFVRNEDYKQFGIGLTKSGTLAPPSWTKTTQTKMYFSLLQQLTWSNFKQWTRDWSSWHMEKIFGYQQGSHQSNVVGGGNSPVGLVSG